MLKYFFFFHGFIDGDTGGDNEGLRNVGYSDPDIDSPSLSLSLFFLFLSKEGGGTSGFLICLGASGCCFEVGSRNVALHTQALHTCRLQLAKSGRGATAGRQ